MASLLKTPDATLDFDLAFIYRKLFLFLVLQCEAQNKKKSEIFILDFIWVRHQRM